MPVLFPRLGRFSLLVILILSGGCQAAPMPPTAAPAATTAAQPSPAPSATLSATATARPTATPAPSATPTAAPTATPTAMPAPTVTPQSVGPGGLPFPLKTAALQFGVAAHLFYTSRALPLKRANEA